MRLINADAVLTRMLSVMDMQDLYSPIHFMELVINEVPTIDPVKHGRWIKVDKHTVKCSKCGNYLDKRGVNAGRGDALYCPNCGAKMDEEWREDGNT